MGPWGRMFFNELVSSAATFGKIAPIELSESTLVPKSVDRNKVAPLGKKQVFVGVEVFKEDLFEVFIEDRFYGTALRA